MTALISVLGLLGLSIFAAAQYAPGSDGIPIGCNEDNCLRALIREGGAAATPFCQSFTTAVVTETASLPRYASMCSPSAFAGISSACSCYVPPPSVTTTTVTITVTTNGTSPTTVSSDSPGSLTNSTALNSTAMNSAAMNSTGPNSTLFGPVGTDGIPIGCKENNCLRAMIREGGATATPFCRSFTASTITATAALPTYASMCGQKNPVSKISSACSCYVPATPASAAVRLARAPTVMVAL